MGVAWVVWPSGGIPVFGKTLRFASLEGMLADANEKKVDVDAVLDAVGESFGMKEDTLSFYRDFFLSFLKPAEFLIIKILNLIYGRIRAAYRTFMASLYIQYP